MAYTFKNILVWQKAHNFVIEVYKATRYFPSEEKYGLTAQLRRSAASVPTNIVEGYKRRTDKDFAHFLNMADSSLEEAKYQIFLAYELKYFKGGDYERFLSLTDEIGRMLYSFQKKLKA